MRAYSDLRELPVKIEKPDEANLTQRQGYTPIK